MLVNNGAEYQTLTRIPIYTTWSTATKKRNVIRLDRCEGLTGEAVDDASGRTTERKERS